MDMLARAGRAVIGPLRSGWQFDARGAALAAPGLSVLLFGGLLLDRVTPASIAAGAAFSVGFGATKRVWHSRWPAMILTGGGMTVVAFLGTLLGHDPRLALAATMAMGGLCGGLIRRDVNLWWVWVQIVIAFLLALRFPGDVADGLRRAALVAAGALVQIAVVRVMLTVVADAGAIGAGAPDPVSRREILLHALRAALCIGAAVAVARAAGIAHGYWAPMTAMLVLKPGLRDTGFRGIERVTGTVAGILIATLSLRLLAPMPFAIAGAAVLAAGCAYALQGARYALLTTAITACVVLMLTLAGGQAYGVERDRLIATLIGGAVALAGAAIAPRRLRWRRSVDDRG